MNSLGQNHGTYSCCASLYCLCSMFHYSTLLSPPVSSCMERAHSHSHTMADQANALRPFWFIYQPALIKWSSRVIRTAWYFAAFVLQLHIISAWSWSTFVDLPWIKLVAQLRPAFENRFSMARVLEIYARHQLSQRVITCLRITEKSPSSRLPLAVSRSVRVKFEACWNVDAE